MFALPDSFKPLSASYISSWMRKLVLLLQLVLSARAHNVRIVAPTLALLRNLSLVEICKRSLWHLANTVP